MLFVVLLFACYSCVRVSRVRVCACVRRRRGRLAELGGGWCVLVRAPGLADDSVREVRLAQVIVAVAVRLREACRRPFWVGLVWGYGVGVKGAEIGCGGFLWGRLVCVSARAGGGGVSIGSTSPWWGLVLWVSGAWLCARPCVLCLLGWSSSVVSVWLGSA